MPNILSTTTVLLATACITLLSACSTSGGGEPSVTHDGLTLVPKSRFQDVYMKPGADLSVYSELGMEPCKVSFKANWMRDQNTSRRSPSNRVREEDVDKIKDALGEACSEQFREALLDEPAYNLVDEFDNGENVLVLRPAIIDLDINAPDLNSPGRANSYTTSAGEMTLYLELADATTNETLARIVDKRRGMDTQRLQWTNSVSNKAEMERILRRWAKLLREGLDEVRSQP